MKLMDQHNISTEVHGFKSWFATAIAAAVLDLATTARSQLQSGYISHTYMQLSTIFVIATYPQYKNMYRTLKS